MAVIEKGETIDNGEPRQQFVLEYPFGETETWIESIGSLYGIIDSGSHFLVGGSTDLLCYYEDGDLIWQNSYPSINSCYFVYSGGQSSIVVTPTVLTFDEPTVPQTFTICNQTDNAITVSSINVQPDDNVVLISFESLPRTLRPNETMNVEVELNGIGHKGYNTYNIYVLTSEGAKVVVVRVNDEIWNGLVGGPEWYYEIQNENGSITYQYMYQAGDTIRVEGMRCYWTEGELVFKYGDEDCDAIYDELHGVDEDGLSIGSGTFMVYPNPTDGVLFVETVHAPSLPAGTYRIINPMGQTLLSGQISAKPQQINVSSLPQGMYFITIAGETRKFVVR